MKPETWEELVQLAVTEYRRMNAEHVDSDPATVIIEALEECAREIDGKVDAAAAQGQDALLELAKTSSSLAFLVMLLRERKGV